MLRRYTVCQIRLFILAINKLLLFHQSPRVVVHVHWRPSRSSRSGPCLLLYRYRNPGGSSMASEASPVSPASGSVVEQDASVSTFHEVGRKRKRTTKVKFYCVRRGHNPGIYHNWPECLAQITGFGACLCQTLLRTLITN